MGIRAPGHPNAGAEAQRGHGGDGEKAPPHDSARNYLRFAAMIVTSTAVMFGLTYTNVFRFDHIRWSEERFYMALMMGGAMAVIMMAFMWRMHESTIVNVVIVAGGLCLIAATLWLSRSQFFVDDREYMRGMIPHHSIAILTSERADIDDVRVRTLADEIIAAQRREISEMEWLIDDIGRNGPARTPADAEARPVPEFAPSE